MIRTILICLLSTLIWAESTVNVTVDRNRIIEGDSIILTITAKNIKSEPDVRLPNLQEFKIVSGPSQSSSTNVQFVNGKVTKSSTTTLSWTLVPIKTGKLTIPAMVIKAGKQSFTSSPVSITVLKREDLQTEFVSQFFIEAELDNKTPYRGEQVILTYTLYTKVDVTSFDDELPKFKGFWIEELFAPKNLQLRESQKNGNRFYAATIKKIALYPTKSGDIDIDPMTAVIGIREKQQRWNDFSLFGPPSKKYTISTNKLELKVQPLPERENGKVSAVVGNWNIRSGMSTTNVKQDEAVTFQVIINGTGNIQTVDISNISFPNELEIFEPEIHIKENPLRDKIGGEKKFEWVLIPRFAGDIYIPKVQLNYFDPKQGKWLTKSTARHRLNVAPNEKSAISSIGLSKEEVALVGKDIRFMDESQSKWRDRNSGLISGTALTLLLLSGMVFAFPHAHSLTRKRMKQTSGGRQVRRALKSAFLILDSKSDTPEEIYTHIYKSVVCFINHKMGLNQVEYSTGEIIDIFKSRNLSKVGESIEQIMIRGETVRFAPISSQDAQNDLQEFKILLKETDDGWL